MSTSIPSPAIPALRGLVRAYYLATPLLALLDVALGLNVRVAFLDGMPAWKWTYYLVCFGLGLVCWRLPRLSGLVGVVESGANVTFLVVGFFLAYYRAVATATEGGLANPFAGEAMTGFLVAITVLILSCLTQPLSAAALDGPGRRRPLP